MGMGAKLIGCRRSANQELSIYSGILRDEHVSHYVQPGAYKLETEGAYTNLLAFRNPDNSIALIIANETSDDRSLSIRIGDRVYTPIVKAYSMNTLLVD